MTEYKDLFDEAHEEDYAEVYEVMKKATSLLEKLVEKKKAWVAAKEEE